MVRPADTRLYADVMLGRLVTYLRMCGYDTAYALDRGVEADDAIREAAIAEDRRLLTRDRRLADRTPDAVLLRSRDVTDQLGELLDGGFVLAVRMARCSVCNGPLERAPDRPADAPDTGPVWRCRDCGQHFWRGSHVADVRERLSALREREP
ncbi:MAG: Mut7-C RNAse domain-containing protein [Halobacteriaceae archaeon]